VSDLFNHLVAKAMGDAGTVRPKPRLPFETGEMSADIEWREEPEDTIRDGLLEMSPIALSKVEKSRPSEQSADQTPRDKAADEKSSDSALDSPRLSHEIGKPPIEAHPHAALQRDSNRQEPLMPLEPREDSPANRSEVSLQVEPIQDERQSRTEREATPSEAVRPRTDETLLPEDVPVLSVEEISAPALPEVSGGEEPGSGTSPTINIGRIEVRPPAPAVNASPVAKPPMRTRAAPRRSLDEFLAKRRR
jgi:hypothetical protein